MKKMITVLILFFLSISSSPAQVEIGLLGGLNFSNADQKELFFSQVNSKTKLAIGGVVNFKLGNNFSIVAEPLYIDKGVSGEPINIEDINAKVSFNASYFEVPILIKYSIGESIKPYIIVGPTIGFNLNSNITIGMNPFEFSVDAENIMNPVEFSLCIGSGLNYKVDELLTFFIEAKYSWGLNDIIKKGLQHFTILDKKEEVTIPGGTSYHNRGVQVMLGFSFPLLIN